MFLHQLSVEILVMDKTKEVERLAQEKLLQSLLKKPETTDMLCLYKCFSSESQLHFIYSALIPKEKLDDALSSPMWNLMDGDGLPFVEEYRDKSFEYFRFGNNSGIEPIVINRDFNGMRNNYNEISEEFRLFHQLYHDQQKNQYIKFDGNGNETIVAILEPDEIKIRVKEIREFLYIKNMYLSVQFDCREHSKLNINENTLQAKTRTEKDKFIWNISYGNGYSHNMNTFSRLIGKVLVEPFSERKNSLSQEKKYVDYVIGLNDQGDERLCSSDPNMLASSCGQHENAQPYLTPVYFKKDVLEKYYQQPSKYSVEDSILRCGSLWSLEIDNHHDEKICVWLGDIGTSLSYQEQMYWRSYNIPPQGKISETYFKRQILAEFTASDRLEHQFVSQYGKLMEDCNQHLGWQILLPLADGDQHHLKCLRIPSSNEQKDFDELVLGLTKILIDSINESGINKLIPQAKNLKGGILRLEMLFTQFNIEDRDKLTHIGFLRRLQSLRSSSSAHRKGSSYTKIANQFGMGEQPFSTVLAKIMEEGLGFINFLIKTVNDKKIKH